MSVETQTSRIRRKLEENEWHLVRRGSNHDIYRHPHIRGIVTLPRHRSVSPGVAQSIARKAGWLQ